MVVLQNTSLTDALCDALRKQIIAGELAPGQKLSEIWVATSFDVARPTAKAALDRLTNEGVLRRGRRRTAVVPRMAAADINDLYFAREPIEAKAVVELAGRGEVPSEAGRALALMRMAAEQGNHGDHTSADIALHHALVVATGSPRLQRMYELVMGESQLCIAQVRRHDGLDLEQLTEAHAAILEAIEAGDSGAAVAALHADLFGCRDTLLADVDDAAADAGTVDDSDDAAATDDDRTLAPAN